MDIHSVGNDSFADVLKSHLAERNVMLSSPTLADIPTGVCIVLSGPVGGDSCGQLRRRFMLSADWSLFAARP